MIIRRRIGRLSVILMVIAAVAVMLLWKYSFDYQSDYELYDNQRIVFTSDDEYAQSIDERCNIVGSKLRIKCNGNGAHSVDKTLYITAGGVYTVEGELENIVVQSADKAPVVLRLNNAYIKSRQEPPIYVYRAAKFILSSDESSSNYIIDDRGKYSDESICAAIYCASDITLNGMGSTSIQGNFRDGIISQNTVKVVSGDWKVSSEDDGISGRTIFQKDGNLTCSTVGDAIKSDKKNNKGLVVLKGGNLDVYSKSDGIFSSGNVYLDGADVNIGTGDGAANSFKKRNKGSESEILSMKGIKADKNIYINAGSLTTDTDDDSIHAAELVKLINGKLTLSAGDDAIHSDKDLCINNGQVDIIGCYEGLEGAYIEINGGDLSIIADDDGINASDGSSIPLPPPGEAPPQGKPDGDFSGGNGAPPPKPDDNNAEDLPHLPEMDKEAASKILFVINGGNLYIESGGDGIDINGSAEINGGTIETYCMKDGPEEAVDFDGSLFVNGGTIFGAGNSNMYEPPSDESNCYNAAFYMDQTYRNGGDVCIKDSRGNIIKEKHLNGSFGVVIAYGENIKQDELYTITVNGNEICSGVIDVVGTVIKPENISMGGFGGPPPMGEGGRPVERPPDGLGEAESMGGPGGPPPMGEDGRPLEPPPDGMSPPGSPNMNSGASKAGIQIQAGNETSIIPDIVIILFISGIGLLLILLSFASVKVIKRKF